MNDVVIAARSITITFGQVDVVRSATLELRAGEIHAICGENGAGKSSLAKVLAGVYQPRLGTVELRGHDIKLANPRDALRNGIGLIHQEPQTFPDLTVAENIFVAHHPCVNGRVDWKRMESEAQRLLDELGVEIPLRRLAGSLSVAQQQMLEVACTLSYDATVWIFDETSAPLTPKEAHELFAVMRKLRDRGCAVAMVSHHLHEVFAVADRITVMRDGAVVGTTLSNESSPAEIVRLMVGRELTTNTHERKSPGAVALEAHGLSGPGFRDVSLKVHSGEIVALAGLIGAGRTELARVLFGLQNRTSGTVELAGEPIHLKGPSDAIQAGIGLVPEDRQHDGLVRAHSVGFNATLARLPKIARAGWFKKRDIVQTSKTALETLNLASRGMDQPVGELSGGNQQKVVLAKWFMTQPRVLILDEPTRGVDVGAKAEVHRLIHEQAESGVAVLVISSDLPEVLALADRVLVMRQGQIVAELPSDTTEEAIMFAATGQEPTV